MSAQALHPVQVLYQQVPEVVLLLAALLLAQVLVLQEEELFRSLANH
jgi:hypothetical protein